MRVFALPGGGGVGFAPHPRGGHAVWLVGRASPDDPGGWAEYIRFGPGDPAGRIVRAVIRGTASPAELADYLAGLPTPLWGEGELPRHLLAWLLAAAHALGR